MVTQANLLYAGALLFALAMHADGLKPYYHPKFKPECSPWDSCQAMRPEYRRDFTQRNCECDSLCTAFRDCCMDAKAILQFPYQFKNRLDTCLRYGIYDEAIYVVGRCPRDYNESIVVKKLCEGSDDFRDPMMSTPVSDLHSASTYRNGYCALCHRAPPSRLKLWRSYLKFDDSYQRLVDSVYFKRKDFIFRHDFKKWGIYENDTFRPFEIVFQKPDYIWDVRRCRPKLISYCPPSWPFDYIARSCRSYMGVVHHEHDAYRNIHCAICNGLGLRQLSCHEGTRVARSIQVEPPSLLPVADLNQMEHNGKRHKCRYGLVYDPFRKMCRKLTVMD